MLKFIFLVTAAILPFVANASRVEPHAARIPREQFRSVSFLSEDFLCGATVAGKTECYDWEMDSIRLPDTFGPIASPADIAINQFGICATDSTGVKCMRENSKGMRLRSLIAESRPGTVTTDTSASCGISAKNGSLVCLVPGWGLPRDTMRIQPKTEIKAVGISNFKICWGDGPSVNCNYYGSTEAKEVYPLSDATEIIVGSNVCARNQTTAKCWMAGGQELLIDSEFALAKNWQTDGNSFCTQSADDRLLCLDWTTGSVADPGNNFIPAEFTKPGSVRRFWLGTYQNFCAERRTGDTVCWNYSGPTDVAFSEPIVAFVGKFADACALLTSGAIECRDSGGLLRTLSSNDPIRANLSYSNNCFWNEGGVDCPIYNLAARPPVRAIERSVDGNSVCVLTTPEASSTGSEIQCMNWSQKLSAVPSSISAVTQFSIGDDRACAISANGLECWGVEYTGEMRPTAFADPRKVLMGANHACALDSFGLVCWGELAANDLEVPSNVAAPDAIVDFAIGTTRTCAVLTDKTVTCWGKSGMSDENPPALSDVNAIYGSRKNVFCAVNSTGPHCWGGETAFPR